MNVGMGRAALGWWTPGLGAKPRSRDGQLSLVREAATSPPTEEDYAILKIVPRADAPSEIRERFPVVPLSIALPVGMVIIRDALRTAKGYGIIGAV